MAIIDRLLGETHDLDVQTGEEARAVLAGSEDTYRQWLARTYGFVAPLEAALSDVSELSDFVDSRRFRKHELLRRDLEALSAHAYGLATCTKMPVFEGVQDALGWAFVIERAALGHNVLFRGLATSLPREAAFASSYLKCYFGAIGEMWRGFVESLELASAQPHHAERLIAAAKRAVDCYCEWSRAAVPVANP